MYLQCTSTAQVDAMAAVIGERSYQDAKWGTIKDRPKQVGSYLTLMRKLLRDAEDAWATSDNDQDALAAMRKAVAIGVACFEQHGVPTRDVDSAVVETPSNWPRNVRLVGYADDAIVHMWDSMIAAGHRVYVDVSTPWHTTFTYDELYEEAMARGLGPIPF